MEVLNTPLGKNRKGDFGKITIERKKIKGPPPMGPSHKGPGGVSIRKTVLPGMAIPMSKIRRPNGRLIFNMEIAIRR